MGNIEIILLSILFLNVMVYIWHNLVTIIKYDLEYIKLIIKKYKDNWKFCLAIDIDKKSS